MCGLLAVSLAALAVKKQLARPDSREASPQAIKREVPLARTQAPARPGIPPAGQPRAAVQARLQESTRTLPTPPSSRQPDAPAVLSHAAQGPAQQPGHSSAARKAAPAIPPSGGALPPANFQAPAGAPASRQASANVNTEVPSAAEPVALELDPGVPVPAALLPAGGENRSPAVAAAQQQIADSFVRDVDAALNQPETPAGDAAVNDAYYDSLTRANELYRALHGDEAFNKKTMQATMEAQAEK